MHFANLNLYVRNYNEPTDGRYCEENDTFCYENRVVMQVIKQVYPLADINGNPDITRWQEIGMMILGKIIGRCL